MHHELRRDGYPVLHGHEYEDLQGHRGREGRAYDLADEERYWDPRYLAWDQRPERLQDTQPQRQPSQNSFTAMNGYSGDLEFGQAEDEDASLRRWLGGERGP